MEVDLDTLLKEGKEWFALRQNMKKSAYPDAGTPCYLLNKDWIERYKKYTYYTNLINDTRPQGEPDHCAKTHPGSIDNSKLL